jgi:ElaB/YqjD/DUF883 family membrane-anchored ribosome-binding protein
MVNAMNKSDIQDKTQEWKDKAEGKAEELRTKVQDKAREFSETAREWQERARESTRRAARLTDEYVHENAWSVLASVALGCLIIGILIGRNSD